jgi:hypothetical protein
MSDLIIVFLSRQYPILSSVETALFLRFNSHLDRVVLAFLTISAIERAACRRVRYLCVSGGKTASISSSVF